MKKIISQGKQKEYVVEIFFGLIEASFEGRSVFIAKVSFIPMISFMFDKRFIQKKCVHWFHWISNRLKSIE